jgi:hypothetical protein
MAAADRHSHSPGERPARAGSEPSTASKLLVFAVLFAVLLAIVAAGVTFTSNQPAGAPPAERPTTGAPGTSG